GTVVASISVSGDSDISVSPTSITFTSTNWNIYQTITVSAKEDDDVINGTATITISAPGISSKTITVIEQDNDIVMPTLSVYPDSIVFKITEFEKQIEVKNSGTKDGLIWEATTQTNWLSVSPSSGGPLKASEKETVTISREGGNAGDTAQILFKNKTPNTTQQDINVNVRINRRPEVLDISIYPSPENDIVRPETFITIIANFKDDDGDKVNEYEYQLFVMLPNDIGDLVDTDIQKNEEGFTEVKIVLPFALFEKEKYYNFSIRCRDENGEWSEWKEISNKFKVKIGRLVLLDENTKEDTTIFRTNVSSEKIDPGVMIYVREINPDLIGLLASKSYGIKRMYDTRIEGLDRGSEQSIKFIIPDRVNTAWKYNPKTTGWILLTPGYSDFIKLTHPTPNSTMVVIIFKDGNIPFDYDKKENGVIVDPLAFGYIEEGPQQVSGGGGCFIATACFGDYNHPIVKILREFRDKFLLRNKIGRIFVRWYYTHSPKYAEIISKSPILKGIVRVSLIPFVIFAYLCIKGLILPLILITLSILILKRKLLKGLFLIIFILLISFSSNISAQDINHFKLISGEKYTIATPTRFLLERGDVQIDLIYSYANSILEGVVGGTNQKIIKSQNLLQTGLTFGFSDRFNLSVLVPYLIRQDVLSGQPYKNSGFGDVYLIGKVKIWDGGRECYGVVLLPYIGFDTGDDNSLINANSTVYGLKFSFDKYLTDKLIGAINLGYSHQKKATIGQINIDDTFLFGASLIYLITDKIHLSGEIIGRSDNGIFKAKESTPVEAIISLGADLKSIQFIIGAGAGIIDGYGTPNWRLFTGIKTRF
ncbi:MAG: transporter, partial [Candidatus Omnitrophica bacterium]|nr:transporter [Candidatus Omnitrophota bacterium]